MVATQTNLEREELKRVAEGLLKIQARLSSLTRRLHSARSLPELSERWKYKMDRLRREHELVTKR